MLQPAALQVGLKLFFHVERQAAVTLGERGQERRVVALHQLVEQPRLRPVALVAHRPGRAQGNGFHARSVASRDGAAPAANPVRTVATGTAAKTG